MRGDTGYDLSAFVADEIVALKRLPHFVSQEDLDAAARTAARIPDHLPVFEGRREADP